MPDAQTVTVLFTDMVGSTALLARLGDEQFDDVRRAHVAVLRDALGAHNGTEVKSTGDGVMAVFASASDAASAAVTIQRDVTRLNQRRPEHGAGVKVGISIGDATSEEGDWFGVPVVEAARLCDAAQGGEILATEIVRVLAGNRGGHRFDSLGAKELKGLPEAVAVCAVRWEAAPDSVAPLPALFSLPEPFPFAGRTRARKTLRESWDAAVAGERRVTLIAGEPGVGKTRLVGELARDVHENGAVVLAGRCDPEIENSMGPWAEALDQLARNAGVDVVDAHIAAWGDALGDLVPMIAQHMAAARTAPLNDPDAGRRRLFGAVIDLIERVAEQSPILLVIDDIHWADTTSLLLLRAFVQHSVALRVLVVGTYRDTDLDRKHPLSGMLADFRRESGVERIGLRGLDGDELVDYLTLSGGRELTDDGIAFAHQLSELTAGNPFFVAQMLQHLSETNALVQQEGRWIAGPVDPAASGVPEGVREVIGRRLSVLDPRADHLFSVAAVIGAEFDLTTLATIADMPEGEALDLLDDGMQRSLLMEEPGRFGVYRFAHALVRQTLLEELSTTRRIHLHRSIAKFVAENSPDSVELIAHHFVEAAAAGTAAEAVEWATRAGARAEERLAYEAAYAWYGAALEAAALLAPDERRDLGLLLARARSRSQFDTRRATDDLLAVAERARAIGAAEYFADAALAYGGALSVWDDFADDRQGPLIREALELLPPDDSERRVRLLTKLDLSLEFAPVTTERRAVCDDALAMARRLGDPDLIAWALAALVNSSRGAAGIAEREAWVRDMDALGETLRAPDTLAGREFYRVCLLRLRGDLAGARRTLPHFLDVARRGGVAPEFYQWSSELPDLVAIGDFAGASALADRGALIANLGDLGVAITLDNRWIMARWCGPLSGLADLITRALDDLPSIMPVYAATATVAWAQGDLVRAVHELESWSALIPFIPSGFYEHVCYSVSAVILDTAAREIARTLLERLEPERRRGTWSASGTNGIYGPAEYTIGVLQLAAGNADDAVSWLRDAVASAERSEAPPWVADSRRMLARALAANGDHGEARAVAAVAKAEAEALGMHLVAAAAEQLL